MTDHEFLEFLVERAEHAAGQRRSSRVTIKGATMSVTQWCRHFGIKPVSVSSRIRKGWDCVRAILQPFDSTKRNKKAR